jgi:DNA repair exonuclease SbcCD ATPase subunit
MIKFNSIDCLANFEEKLNKFEERLNQHSNAIEALKEISARMIRLEETLQSYFPIVSSKVPRYDIFTGGNTTCIRDPH